MKSWRWPRLPIPSRRRYLYERNDISVSLSQGCGSGMDAHYFWKLDPDPHLSEKLEVAKIAYSKQKEVRYEFEGGQM
jgi:hypothetical protein